MYAHYANVWAEMQPSDFTIILLGTLARTGARADAHAQQFIDRVRALDYEVEYLDEIVYRKIKYRYVVSNHIMGGSAEQCQQFTAMPRSMRWMERRKALVNSVRRLVGLPRKYSHNIDPLQFHPLQAGIYQIRFMYGADISDSWSLDAWNAIYDLFLCHGPNDEMHLKSRFKGRTAIMGYPRYDGYFSAALDTDAAIAEFHIDLSKQTLLWMPTIDAFKDDVCSIPFFAESLAAFKDDFNIIVRPHPISFRDDPAGIALLESLCFEIDRDPMRDMNALFKVADVVLCDHGGSAFGALYLGKKIIFLKTPTKETATVLKESSNLELMQHFPAIGPDETCRLKGLVLDDDYWQTKLAASRSLSDRYFADLRGSSSKRAAGILSRLDSLFPAKETL